MKRSERLSQLLDAQAAQAVPDNLDLWPALRTRLEWGRGFRQAWHGALTLSASLLVVALVGGLLLAGMGQGGTPGLSPGQAQAATATPLPTSTPLAPPSSEVRVTSPDLLNLDDGPQVLHFDREHGDYALVFTVPAEAVLTLQVEVEQVASVPVTIRYVLAGAAPSSVLSVLWPPDAVQVVTFNPAEVPGLMRDFADVSAGTVYALVSSDPARYASGEETALRVSLLTLSEREGAGDDATALGGDAAAALPPGMVAVTIPLGGARVAYGVQEGDRVDVVLSLNFVDVDEAFQILSGVYVGEGEDSPTLPEGRTGPFVVVQRVLDDGIVVRLGAFPVMDQDEGTPPPAPPPSYDVTEVIALAVTPQQATVLTWAIEARVPILVMPAGWQGWER